VRRHRREPDGDGTALIPRDDVVRLHDASLLPTGIARPAGPPICYSVRIVRTSAQAATEDLVEALTKLKLGLTVRPGDPAADLILELPGGAVMALEVKALRSVTTADATRLIHSLPPDHAVPIVVADRIVPDARSALRGAGWGWLDRRGHLRLAGPGLAIDSEVSPLLGDTGRNAGRPALDTDVGLDVGVAVLTQPDRRWSVRDLVAFTDRSLGAVHQALRSLREEGLMRRDGTPLTPELFWELSARWRPARIPLGVCPGPGDARRTDQLDLGLDDIQTGVGWALTDTLAANAFGAFAVVRGNYPPDFYVPDERNLRVSRQLYGDAISFETRGATVALCPASWACLRRVDLASIRPEHPFAEFGSVHPVIAALDLSTDEARGREVLDEWSPPDPWRRVW
jgi:hypothetical protein